MPNIMSSAMSTEVLEYFADKTVTCQAQGFTIAQAEAPNSSPLHILVVHRKCGLECLEAIYTSALPVLDRKE